MAAIDYLSPINLNKNELQNPRAQNLALAPSGPVSGQWYFDTALEVIRYWDGAAWIDLHAGWLVAVNVTAPITSTGGTSPTIGIDAATASDPGSMSAADKAKLDAATSANTPSTLVMRDGSGDLAVHDLTANRVTGLAAPSAGTDAVNLNYVSNLINGSDWKSSARVATAAALPAYTRVANVLTANANGSLNTAGVDGVDDLAVGERILLKDGAAGADNGLYAITDLGDGGSPWVLTRSEDADTSAEVTSQMTIPVAEGTENGGKLFKLTTNDPITLNTTSLNFELVPGSLAYAEGTGIDITGNVISIDTAWVGQTAITTLGTITVGTWSATTIAVNKGGTGATTPAGARTNLGATGKYSQLIGDNSASSFAITQATHGLAVNGEMTVAVYDAATGAQIFTDVSINSANGTVTVTFSAVPATDSYRVVIIG